MINHPTQATNRLYALKTRLTQERRPIHDWVSGNVTEQGIIFPAPLLESAFREGLQRAQTYRPHPLGQLSARQSISVRYARDGISIPPENLLLTPGTSQAYLYAFKLLAAAGDEILCPAPNYPLLDQLAELAGIKLTSYPLLEAKNWAIDIPALARAVTPHTRAIVLISPHNPTGHITTQAELDAVAHIATEKNLAVISDEVFGAFGFAGERPPVAAHMRAPLIVTLDGLSKQLALPGLKLAWMGVTGTHERVTVALERLDWMSDAFLPVSEPTQFALPWIFEKGADFQQDYIATIRERAHECRQLLQTLPGIEVLPTDGGFYTVLRLQRGDEEEVACRILEKTGVLMHPGYFYDMPGDHLVLSHVGQAEQLQKHLTGIGTALNGE